MENVSERQWAMALHISQLAGYIIPLGGFVIPILIWQLKKNEIPSLDEHGKMVCNWILSSVIYAGVSALLCFVVIGIPMIIALGVVAVVFPVVGCIKANDGIVWKYPLTIRFFT